jgi:Bax protein
MKRWSLPVSLALLFLLAGVTAWWLPERAGDPEPAQAPTGSVSERKTAFIDTMLPAIRAQNDHIREQRARIQKAHKALRKGRTLPESEREWLLSMARKHRLAQPDDGELSTDWVEQLRQRVDVIPADLALAQAALESAWGQSRFARQGNNFFGQWCFTEGCGLVPKRRAEGATHEVQVFDSVSASVQTYMRNLNSHPAYTEMRRIRAKLRARGQPLRGPELAEGLNSYAGIGTSYADRLSSLIEHNDLERFRREEG